jgi:hypothetical protein
VQPRRLIVVKRSRVRGRLASVTTLCCSVHLVSVEIAKYFFFRTHATTTSRSLRRENAHHIHRIAARWTHGGPLPPRPTAPA